MAPTAIGGVRHSGRSRKATFSVAAQSRGARIDAAKIRGAAKRIDRGSPAVFRINDRLHGNGRSVLAAQPLQVESCDRESENDIVQREIDDPDRNQKQRIGLAVRLQAEGIIPARIEQDNLEALSADALQSALDQGERYRLEIRGAAFAPVVAPIANAQSCTPGNVLAVIGT